jgi:hypothetical protein
MPTTSLRLFTSFSIRPPLVENYDIAHPATDVIVDIWHCNGPRRLVSSVSSGAAFPMSSAQGPTRDGIWAGMEGASLFAACSSRISRSRAAILLNRVFPFFDEHQIRFRTGSGPIAPRVTR